jgi:hypothetical protein
MNYTRLALAAAAAFVVQSIYGFVVYGMLLMNQFGEYPGVYRPGTDTSHLPVLFAGILVGALAAAYIYAVGYEGGSGLSEGLRFGVAMSVFVTGYVSLINWAVLNIGRSIALTTAAAAFVEFVLVGLAIGLVYKPAVPGSSKRAARV